MNRLVGPAIIYRSQDVLFGGIYRITGIVTELGAPGKYMVRLFRRYDARFLRQTWSAADGSYTFDNIAFDEYFVVGHDNGEDRNNGAIGDPLTPEPMP